MSGKITKGTWETLNDKRVSCIRRNRKQGILSRESDMPIVAMKSKDNITYDERRGITLTMPPKERGTGRLPEGLPTPEAQRVQDFQRRLYLKAKRKEKTRFYSLYDKVYSRGVLNEAWKRVRANKGSAGVDGKAIEDIEIGGIEQFICQIQTELKDKKYRADDIKRVFIPKPNGGKRPLGIPTIKDRVVQMATKIVIEPIFEAGFQECSYGFRPKRTAHQALREIKRLLHMGYVQVIDADLKSCFDTIPHNRLMELIAKRVGDKNILGLIKQWLKAGILSEGVVNRNSATGTPQGGVISPLLANIYLNELDKIWNMKYKRQFNARLIRYADDFVVMSGRKMQDAYKATQTVISDLGLKLNEEKTQMLDMRKDKLTFLGYSFKKIYDKRKNARYFISFPSAKAMNAIRKKVKGMTSRKIPEKAEVIVSRLNPVIRGWANYFVEGNSSKWFSSLRNYTENKVRRFIRKHKQKVCFGYSKYPRAYLYEELGLYYLTTKRVCLSSESV